MTAEHASPPSADYAHLFDLRKLVRNFGWLGFDQIVRMFVGLAVNIVLVRYLGPSLYGKFNYALYLAGLAQYLALFELDRIVVRDLSQRPQDAGRILGTTCMLRLAVGSIGFGSTIALCAVLRPDDPEIVVLLAIMNLSNFAQSIMTIDLWFQSRYQSKFTVTAKLVANIAVNLVKVPLILLGVPLWVLAIMFTAELLATAALLAVVYHRRGGRFATWTFDRAVAAALLRQAGILLIAGVATQVQVRADIVIIGYLMSNHDVGLYSAALRLVEAANFVPVIIMTSMAPLLAAAHAASRQTFESVLLAFYNVMSLLGWTVAIGFWLTSDFIVALLYGPAYAASGPLLALLGFRFLLTGFGIGKSMFLTNTHRLWFITLSAITGMTAGILLSMLLIPRYGAFGAVYASIASIVLRIFVIDLFWAPTRRNLWLMCRALVMPWPIGLSQLPRSLRSAMER
jgi:O-antigen/teichoic acid export membrane protein